MGTSKREYWKTLLASLCLSIALLAWLGFGERGLFHLYRSEMERQAHVDKIRLLAEENRTLMEEVRRLRNDMNYVESLARRELNLIKKNEVIYRFGTERHGIREGRSLAKDAQHDNESQKLVKEE